MPSDGLGRPSATQGGRRSARRWARRGGHSRCRVFYFQPGHETYPIYHDANIQRVLLNACQWAAFDGTNIVNQCVHSKDPLSPIPPKR